MKKIDKPFAESDYSVMSKVATDYELRSKAIADLKFLRDRIAAGQMTAALYDFINVDYSLEHLLPGLPRPVEGVSCESFKDSQLEMIDAVIAQEEFNMKSWILQIWNALKEWLADYFDRNRVILRTIKWIQAEWRSNSVKFFGDPSQFGATNVLMYRCDEWSSMCSASRRLTELCKKMPQKPEEIENWLHINTSNFDTYFRQFGKFIDESGNVITGSPKYIRQNDVASTLGWIYADMPNHIKNIIEAMDDEINLRRQISNLEKLFTTAANSQREAFAKIRKYVVASKTCTLTCGRIFAIFMKQVARARQSQSYRM